MVKKKVPKEIKLEVVRAIVCGELLVKEAMAFYDIKYKTTIIRWVKLWACEVKENLKNEKMAMKDKAVEDIYSEYKDDQQDMRTDGSSK